MKKFFAVLLCVFMLAFMCGVSSAVTVEVQGMADVVFIIDTTGSMRPYINNVKDNLEIFANYLITEGVDARFSVVRYKDVEVHGWESTRVSSFNGSEWTQDVELLENELNRIARNEVGGGGDLPETPQDPLNQVASWQSFRNNAVKAAFVLTDTNSKRVSGLEDINTTADSLSNMGISISVICKMEHRDHYYNLFTKNDGVYIDIEREDFWKSMADLASWISDLATVSEDARLPYSMIETVDNDQAVVTRVVQTVTTTTTNTTITNRDIHVVTTNELTLPHEPTDEVKAKANGLGFLTKIDTITLDSTTSSTSEYGYYLFQLDVSGELLAQGLTVGNSTEFGTGTNGFVDFIMMNPQTGSKIERLTADATTYNRVLLLIYGKNGDAITLYFVKDLNGVLRLWSADAAEFGDGYADKSRDEIIEDLREDVHNLVDDATDLFKKFFGDSGSSGCNSGIFGIAGLILVAGILRRR